MLRTALRNVFAHKARLLMTVLAVLLGVAFVSGTLVFTSTISAAFQKSSEKGYSNVDLAIRPSAGSDGGGRTPGRAPVLDQATLDKARDLPGAESVSGSVTGFAALADKKGKLVGEGWQSSGANYDAGADGEAEDARYPMSKGRAPQKGDEIALDAKTAARTGYKVGDTARMSIDGPVREERVVGIFTTDDGNVAAGGTPRPVRHLHRAAALRPARAVRPDHAEGRRRHLAGELKTAAKEILPARAEAVTGKKLAADQSETIKKSMSGMQTALLVFAGISLFVGIFIIANTFTMLVAQRTKELALLRAVGAEPPSGDAVGADRGPGGRQRRRRRRTGAQASASEPDCGRSWASSGRPCPTDRWSSPGTPWPPPSSPASW